MLDVNKVIADTTAHLNYLKTVLKVYKNVNEALSTFDGKQVSKRFATAIEKMLGEQFTVYYDKNSYYTYIYIWGEDISYNNRISFNFDDGDTPFNLAVWSPGRVESCQKAIEVTSTALLNVHAVVVNYNKAEQDFNKAKEAMAGLSYSNAQL